MFIGSWNLLISKYQIASKFTTDNFDYLLYFKLFKGDLSELKFNISIDYLNALVTRPIIVKPFKLSYFHIETLILLILIVISLIFKKNRKTKIIIAIMRHLGSIGYAYAMMLSYVYSFPYEEAVTLTMFDRYMLLYVLSGLILIIMYLINGASDNKDFSLLITVVFIFLFTSNDTIISNKPVLRYNGLFDDYSYRFVEKLKETKQDDRIMLISQNDVIKMLKLRFYGIENENKIDYVDVKYFDNYEDTGTSYNQKEFINLLKEYDYVYVCDIDDSIFKLWNKDTINEDCKVDHFYKIDKCSESYCSLTALYRDY